MQSVRRLARPAVLLLLASTHALAQERAESPANAPRMVVGNEVWQPGWQYVSGGGWLALACDPGGCAFEPARLVVKRGSRQGHYDAEPTMGQTLSFARLAKNARQPVAWFHAGAPLPWLHAGPVTTWASVASGFRRADGPGTLELAVAPPTGTPPARFVPLLDRKAQGFTLQLRSGDKRQRLGVLGSCSHVIGTDYLLWAGDLDGDGRSDYLVTYVDDDGDVVLYLSGLAGADELVGSAAVYAAPPSGYECDGNGWFD